MNKFFGKYRSVIVWIVAFSFLVGGGVLGYGLYLSGGSNPNMGSQQAQAVAEVNKDKVSYNEYMEQLQALGLQSASGLSSQQILGYQYYALSNAIDKKLLLQQAKSEKIKVKVSNKEIDEFIEKTITEAEITKEELENILRSRGMTLSQWKEILKVSFNEDKSIKALMDKVTKDVTVSEEEIIEQYEKVRLSNIFVAKDTEGAKDKINEALTKVNAAEDFAEVAKNYSEGVNTEEGGDLGFMSKGDASIDQKLVDEAFTLAVGQVSDVLETEVGYYIVKVTDKKEAYDEAYETEKVKIEEEIMNKKKSEAQSAWFQNVKNEANIVINMPSLAAYAALTKSDYEVAVAKFEEALQNSPENTGYLAYLGDTYVKMDKKDKAIETFEKAINFDPTSWESYFALGNVYKEMDKKEKALENYKKASENAGDEYMVRFQLKSLFTELGEEELANEEQEIIMDIAQKIQEQQMQQNAENSTDNN